MSESPAHRPLAGILWMLLTGLCFVAVTATVKHLGQAVPAAQAAFLRYALGLVFVIPMIRPMLRSGLGRRGATLAGLRAAAHTLAVILWFFAMARIPIADVTAMNYLAPVYISVGAALFLGERLASRRIAAILVALAGALVILRPGFRELSSGHIAMLFTAPAFAVSYLMAKRLTAEISPLAVVGLLSVGVTIGLAPFAAVVWVPPTPVQLLWLLLVAFFATAGHYSMTRAFEAAPLAVTQPVTFLQLVWATLLGIFVFGEAFDPWVVLGGSMVVGAVSFISWRESALRRRAATPPDAAAKL
ncbi:DMT family transporter [Rhodovulum sp. YNF3179]|uniref:DMT family transporter n=1 Tax=Rhodovulum sp. YNF3179 TaxID=3425127 RepID=UPI003D340D1B